jgi:hypothetical protein
MSTLVAPPASLKKYPLATVDVDPAKLFRISAHASGEPFHGKTGSKRFDDPRRRFGTCYMGFTLECAIAETVLHDLMPVRGEFRVSISELASRNVVRFKGRETLTLVDLAGAQLKTLVGSSELSTIVPYDLPQQWARVIHAHPQKVDGIQFVSRQLNDQKAVVIFDRARDKLQSPSYTALMKARGALDAIARLHIAPKYS